MDLLGLEVGDVDEADGRRRRELGDADDQRPAPVGAGDQPVEKRIIVQTRCKVNTKCYFFPPLPCDPLSSCQIFLPLISALPALHEWGGLNY